MKGIVPPLIIKLISLAALAGITVALIKKPEILPEPLRSFFETIGLFVELLGVSIFHPEFPELRILGTIIFLPLMMGLVYLLLRLLRGGG